MADLPGGASGLLCRDYKGKGADRLVTRLDPGVVSLAAELRAREQPRNGSNVASPQPAARRGEPAQVFPANAAAPDGRPRLDGVICWSRSLGGKRFGRRLTGRSR
jgi:hypothetical protein